MNGFKNANQFFSLTKLFVCARRARGISQIVSAILLTLVVSSFMSALTYIYFINIENEKQSIETNLRFLRETVLANVVVDSYYISSNSTVVIVLYISDSVTTKIVRAYIDNRPVLPSQYIAGFNQYIPAYTFFKIMFVAPVSPGRHHVILITEGGGRIEAVVEV